MLLTGLSRASIYLRISKQEFPKTLKLGRRAIGWTEAAIVDWQQTVMEAQNESA